MTGSIQSPCLPGQRLGQPLPRITVCFAQRQDPEQDGIVLRFFNTIATLGAPQDVTLQGLRIETLHPANAETDRRIRAGDRKSVV